MPEGKKQSVVILKNCDYTSSLYGNRQFKKGEKLKIIPRQKEDYSEAGISKAFVKILKLNKQINN